MRHGLALPQFGRHAKPAAITSFVRCAEDLGYRSFWAGDRVLTPVDPSDLYPVGGTPEHPYPDEFTTFLDPIVTLAAAATAASHSRVSFSALNAPWYNPVLLARSMDPLLTSSISCGKAPAEPRTPPAETPLRSDASCGLTPNQARPSTTSPP